MINPEPNSPRRATKIPGLRRVAAVLAMFVGFGSFCTACNIPVFRYALERWRPDSGEIIVFTDGGNLPKQQQAKLSAIQQLTTVQGGFVNLRLKQHAVGHNQDRELDSLWNRIRKTEEVNLPYVMVRSRVGKNKLLNSWQGPLEDFSPQGLLNSPVRKELSKRLLTGDSAVWLVIRSTDEDQNRKLETLLKSDLEKLSKDIPLPDGIGAPGSELFSKVPLLMKFSVIAVDATDPKEQHLVNLVQKLRPQAVEKDEPLVIPVFGRGRALEVIPASQVDTNSIKDLTQFLCGACSCQVKELNPGFDLLTSTDWTTELFGEGAVEPTPNQTTSEESDGLPVLIPIPSGKKN